MIVGVVGMTAVMIVAMIVGMTAVTAIAAAPMIGVGGTAETGKFLPRRPLSKTTSSLSCAMSSVTSGQAEARIAEEEAGAATEIAPLANPVRHFIFQAGLLPLGPISSRSCFG